LWDDLIYVEFDEDRFVVSPYGPFRLLRFGEPFIALTKAQILKVTKVAYRLWFPIPALEVCYEHEGKEGAYVIGYLWQKRSLERALS
jgi:hypothetical protein